VPKKKSESRSRLEDKSAYRLFMSVRYHGRSTIRAGPLDYQLPARLDWGNTGVCVE
jgi:hypothetical protein